MKKIKTAIVETIKNAKLKSVCDYQELVANILLEYFKRGYSVSSQEYTNAVADIRLRTFKGNTVDGRGQRIQSIVSTQRKALSRRDGFPDDSNCHIVKLTVCHSDRHTPTQILAERSWYFRPDDRADCEKPFRHMGAMWDTAAEALTAVKKTAERQARRPDTFLNMDLYSVRKYTGKDILRLYTASGKTVLDLVHETDGYEDVKEKDITCVYIRHSSVKRFTEISFWVEIQGKEESLSWNFSHGGWI